MKHDRVGKFNVTGFDDIFGEKPGEDSSVIKIKLEDLHPFKNHPFKVMDDERMTELSDSIKENGVLIPAIVREDKENGGYELISGHRRKRACELAGVMEMPCHVKELTDDEAVIIMVDTNIQREQLLPSEKAFAYKMKLDAMKHQGKNIDMTSTQVVQKLSIEEIGDAEGISREKVRRYIRLTQLKKDLLDMVDDERILFGPAVEISYLNEDQQELLLGGISWDNPKLTLEKAKIIRKYAEHDDLTTKNLRMILLSGPAKPVRVSISEKRLRNYFPEEYSQEQMEEIIYSLLEKWKESEQ